MSPAITIDDRIWAELPTDEHVGARRAMDAIARLSDLRSSPQVAALPDARDGSFRLRHGRYRILFLRHSDGALCFTTAFLKRRGSDYVDARRRHSERARAAS